MMCPCKKMAVWRHKERQSTPCEDGGENGVMDSQPKEHQGLSAIIRA